MKMTKILVMTTVAFAAFPLFATTYYKINNDAVSTSSFAGNANKTSGWSTNRNASAPDSSVTMSGNDFVVQNGTMLRSPSGTSKTFSGATLKIETGGNLLFKGTSPATITIPLVIGAGGSIGNGNGGSTQTLKGNGVNIESGSSLTFKLCATRTIVVDSTLVGDDTTTLDMLVSSEDFTGVQTLEVKSAAGFFGEVTGTKGDYAGTFVLKLTGGFGGKINTLPSNTTQVLVNYDGLGAKGLEIATTAIPAPVKTTVTLYSSTKTWLDPGVAVMTFPEGTTVNAAEFTVNFQHTTSGPLSQLKLERVENEDHTISLVVAPYVAVSGVPQNFGESTIDYGLDTSVTEGVAKEYSVPAIVELGTGHRAVCEGWELSVLNADGSVTVERTSANPLAGESTTTCLVTGPGSGCKYLKWQWREEYYLTLSSADSSKGTVPASGWVSSSPSYAVATVPASGYVFYCWTGDTDGMNAYSATITMDRARTLVATFRPRATLYWKGPGNASDLANWCADAALTVAASDLVDRIVDGDDIVLGAGAGNMTWNLNDVAPGSWTQTTDYAGTVTFYTGRRNGIPTSTALKIGNSTVYLCGVTDDGGLTRTFKVLGNCSLQGGVWTHSAQPTKTTSITSYAAHSSGLGVFRILADIGGNLDIGSAFSMDASGKGFDANARGPGGNGGVNDSANHAGLGGKNVQKGSFACYGRFRMPNTIGSAGSAGGGAIEMTVAGALTMASGATLQANGVDAANYAGAGGSISIVAGSISGAGTFKADGGATTGNSGGGGGGGRISIILTGANADFSGFSGTYSTWERHQVAGTTGADGFGGTVYLETAADGVGGGILMVDGSVQAHYRDMLNSRGTPITAEEAQYNLKKIVLRNGGRLVLPTGIDYNLPPIEGEVPNLVTNGYVLALNNTLHLPANYTIPANCGILTYNSSSSVTNYIKMGEQGNGTLTLAGYEGLLVDSPAKLMGSLVIANGGSAGHSFGKSSAQYKFNLTVTGNATINQGGAISAKGRGYGKTVGQGYCGSNRPGIYAGRGHTAPATTHCYGSVREPTAYGSGGYIDSAGGAIKLLVAGNFVNNGSVDANGADCQYYSGSGGSVWITARTITGSGSYFANGGGVTKNGGTGSGGRVSLWITDPASDFSGMTGTVGAYGGNNSSKNLASSYLGGAGTVYLKSGAQAENGGTLIIRGERNSDYAAEFLSPNVTDTDVGDVLIDTYGKLLLTNVTMTVAGSWTNNNVMTAAVDSFVEFTDASRVAHVTGNNAFRSIVCTAPGKVIRFPASGTSVGATGYFTIAGAQGNPVVLREESNGPWTFSVNASAMADVEYVDVANCDASGGQTIVARHSAASAGQNNTNWNFPSIEPGQTITWTGATSSNWADPGNWDLERVPVDTDRAVIPALGSGADMPSFSGAAVQLCDLTVASGATLSLAGLNLTVTNAMTVAGSIVCSGSETITCLGNINLAGATIVPAHSDFRIAGDLVQTANLGNLEFWNVIVSKTGGSVEFSESFSAKNKFAVGSSDDCTVTFAAGKRATCEQFAASGPAGGGLVLSGSGWNLNVAAYASVENCSVGGCMAGGIKIYPESSCTDLGSNVNWVFASGIVRWTGGAGTTSFTDGENWSSGSVPGENDRVAIDSAVTVAISESVSVKSIDLGGGENAAGLRVRAPLEVAEYVNVLTNGTLTADDACTIGECLAVMNGGVLTHTANTSAGLYKIDVSCGQLYVEEGGAVSAKGCGFPTQTGPGKGPYNCAAAYGGIGNPGQEGAHAYCYGSVFAPVDLGSGGYYSNGAGGGAIKIFATGEMRVDGAIDADGQRGPQYYSGSGGSVYLSCSALTGCGAIRANGGVTTTGYQTGGGGRIAIYETVARDFSLWEGAVTAYGGRHNGVDSPGGSAGTVYYQTAADASRGGLVVIANMGGTYTYGTEIPASIAAGADSPRDFKNVRFELRNSAKMVVTTDMKVHDVSVAAGGYLYCTNNTLRIISSVHKNAKGWARQATTSPYGAVIWAAGFTVTIR